MPNHLTAELSMSYMKLLEKNRHLYEGHLGRMRFDDYILPLSSDYKPVHAKPYPILRSQDNAAIAEVQCLIQLGVLDHIYDSEITSPAFFVTKPNGSLRLLIDYRVLNRWLRRSPYFVPRIREILLRLSAAKCLTTLNANMGYYCRQLGKQSRPLTAFCLPFGKYQYKRLPMGISTAPDEYQACMEKIFGDLDFVVVYLDDLSVFSRTNLITSSISGSYWSD